VERHRVRIRFRKQGDLRLIGHRDLARALERLFRRAALPLRRSEGFHPKARLSFPSALALGIEGTDEVMDVELTHPVNTDSLGEQLNRLAPAGLTINSAHRLEAHAPKAHVARVVYEIPVPEQRLAALQDSVGRLLAKPQHLMERPGRTEPIDCLAGLEELKLDGGVLRLVLRATGAASANPRLILQALGSADLEQLGSWLTRTTVELAP
jgi:radical SAM-linked protein